VASFNAATIGRLAGTTLDLTGFRNQASGFDPRSGEGARRMGGRYNPPRSYPVIYLCTTRPCVVAELTRQSNRQGLAPDAFLPRELWHTTSSLTKVLDLTEPSTLAELGFSSADLVRDAVQLTRAIGEAAHDHGFQAIQAPSAAGVDQIVAVFTENLRGAVVLTELVEV
jgi:RES domain-containing protein